MELSHLFSALHKMLDRLDASNPEERQRITGALTLIRETCRTSLSTMDQFRELEALHTKTCCHRHASLVLKGLDGAWLSEMHQRCRAAERTEQKHAS